MMRRKANSRTLVSLALLLFFFLAGWARTLKLDWDEGTHLHPDERYLTMVASALDFPQDWRTYWDTATSPLNPSNRGYQGYVYGTLPLFAARAAGGWLDGACGETPRPLPSLVRRLAFHAEGPCNVGTYTGYGGIHLVGRLLSTLADLLTMAALVLLARLLFDERVALLAAALYAFTVLPIQHAHFFVVDSFASLFVLWTILLALLWVKRRRPLYLILAGVTTGLATASKISTAPVALAVAVAALLVPDEEGGWRFALDPKALLLGMAGGVLALLTFRAAQPYAFTGPTFWDFRFDPAWKETMRYIRHLMAGDIDAPPGHQWTDRAPILFPLKNMLFWGMGLPLGVAAWLGWAGLGWWGVRRRRWPALIPWGWGMLFFLYQATQWVKSMRYFLPIYPLFVLFAAWGLVRAVNWGRARGWGWRLATRGALVLVLAGTFFWAWAFLHIYLRPFTRVEASRWIYANLPPAITLEEETGLRLPVPLVPETPLRPGESSAPVPFSTSRRSVVLSLRLTKVRTEVAGLRRFVVSLLAPDGTLMSTMRQEVELEAGRESVELRWPQPLTLEPGMTYALRIELEAGAPVILDTTVLGNEHWDDALPLRLDGHDPFYNWYRGLHNSPDTLMDLYNEDNAAKREQLLDWLDDVDAIVLSSNRLYASIPRLAQRYPLTTAYYRALFDGSLGFRPAAEFVSFPSLGPCQFPDQEMPFGRPSAQFTNALPCSLPWPPAEEAFSVYDHPRVLIFIKTEAYSRERAEALLPLSLAESAVWMTPKEATRHRSPQEVLLLSDEERAVQEAGGTWRLLFPPDAPKNLHPWLGALLWWALLTLLGLVVWPFIAALMPDLHGGGYGLARAAGLLLWAYPAWLLASLHLVIHTRLLLWAVFAALALLAFLFQRRRGGWRALFREHGEAAARVEILFALLFLFWLGVRYLNPDLYHPVAGGEKPMDFAYLNAVLRSSWFPPYDPWFAGAVMNYYYFGFVLVGAPMKALGIDPSVGYNLAVAMLFALTGAGAFTLAASLSGRKGKRAVAAGLWGTALVLLLGNWGEFSFLFKAFAELGNIHFDSYIPGYPELVSALAGMWKVLFGGEKLMVRPEWWYWNASRLIPPGPGEVAGPINEFPLFTYLYGDLHAHAMALPLAEVAVGLAIQWGSSAERRGRLFWQTLFGALLLGALRAANSWDYPTYFVILSGAYALPCLYHRCGRERRWAAVLMPVALLLGAELLFRPFLARYLTTYTSFELWDGGRTGVGDYLLIHGPFLLPLTLLAVAEAAAWWRRFRRERMALDLPTAAVVAGGILVLTVVLAVLGVPVAKIVVPLGGAMALFLLAGPAEEDSPSPLLWFFVGAALGLTLMVELIVLKGDLGRMNTVFKFYFQVWLLLGVAAAVAMDRLMASLLGEGDALLDPLFRRRWMAEPAMLLLTLSLFASALYPLFAIPAKVHDRWVKEAPHTLDGTRFLRYALFYEEDRPVDLSEEARVIDWIRLHVDGSPVVMEQNAPVEYVTFGNRISIYTGLPDVIGWRWHQVQQLMALPPGTVEARQDDVRRFYDTPDPQEAMGILRRYGVRYVVVTPYERLRMTAEGEAKFAQMVAEGMLEVAFDDEVAQVYRVRE